MTTPAFIEVVGTLSPTEKSILSVASTTFGRPLGAGDVTVPLSILGADSLGLIELASGVERALGVHLPPEIAHEGMTIRELAAECDRHRSCAAVSPAALDPFARMFEDSVLPDDIKPGKLDADGTVIRTKGLPRPLLDGTAILVTGATGFLGGRLAADLLERTDARLFCTARGGRERPFDRVSRRLLENGVSADTIARRVVIVEADLAQPRLGMTVDAWCRLGDSIDQVLHAGASVNWVATYAALRAANVLGTLELLRLASRPTPIPFHFISSLSVCYAVDGPRRVDEKFDPLPRLRGVHLGYAQTKVVAEALVGEAARRGLPVTIHRPSLISGDSRTGAFNPDDLLSRLIRGSVLMGAAPDLDWTLDCEPVDVVSAAVLALSDGRGGTTHLRHRRARHWRECLVWMRLAGYDVRLVPFATWLAQLDRDSSADLDHPLRALRAFFSHRPAGADGLTLPELYEDSRRTTAAATHTDARLPDSLERPALDASLLERYFDAYRAAGQLPTPEVASDARPAAHAVTATFDCSFFAAALQARGHTGTIHSARCLSAGSEHSIISELTAWRSRQPAGIFRYELDVEVAGEMRTRPVILKLKPHADDATAVGAAVARLCDGCVGDAYARWQDRIGFAGSHLRERAIYEAADERLTQYLPALLGVATLDARGSCALVLEDLHGSRLMDSTLRTPWWRTDDIEVALDGLADMHAWSYGRTAALGELSWIGFRHSAESMIEMADLWRGLADHAAAMFAHWGGSGLTAHHRLLVDSIDAWRPIIDRGPHSLIHHDFNPRNVCLREGAQGPQLCAYDWELATIGAPQRDLAEFLCFVLPANAADRSIDRWIERQRGALERAAGVTIDPASWHAGFGAAMNDFLVTRLAMYALVHRVRPQAFLPRVVASWQRINDCVGRAR